MNGIMQQAQAMQKKMEALQEELKKKTVEATSGGGMVTVVVNGKHELISLKIDPVIVDSSDMDMLQDLILLAVNEGQRKAQKMAEEEMGSITGGLNIPGLF